MKSTDEIDIFEKTIGQLNKLIIDFYDLSKRKPDEAVNKFKLGLVNSILEKINMIIDVEDKPFEAFTLFSEDDLPSNSDVLVILNQYHNCSKNFAEKNVQLFGYENYWVVNGKKVRNSVSLKELFGGEDE